MHLKLSTLLPTLLLCLWFSASVALASEKASANFSDRIEQLEEQVSRLERSEGSFSDSLFRPLVSLAEIYLAESDHEAARDVIQRAQNISHRNHGVYTPKQLELIQMLASLALIEGNFMDADQQQQFSFYLDQRNLDDDDPAILAAYTRMSEWFMHTGQGSHARQLLQESIALAEKLEQNPLPFVILLNKAYRLSGTGGNPKQLLELLQADTGNDPDTLSRAWLEIADSLVSLRGSKGAAEAFSKAAEISPLLANAEPAPLTQRKSINEWSTSRIRHYSVEPDFFGQHRFKRMTQEDMDADARFEPQWFLLNAEQTQQRFWIPDSRNRTTLVRKPQPLVGDPLMFSEKQLDNLLSINNKANKHAFSIEVSFTVRSNGDLADVKLVESNAPNRLNRLIMDVLRRTHYRPALEKGIPVERRDVRLVQTFKTASFSGQGNPGQA